jgi:hypothetical protein
MPENNSNKESGNHSHKGHMRMMAICCGVPIIGFLAIAVLGISMPSLETALLLICPIGMIAMMYFMRRDHCASSKRETGDNPDQTFVGKENERIPVPNENEIQATATKQMGRFEA